MKAAPAPGRKKSSIDLGLAVAAAHSAPGVVWTLEDLAEICDCSRMAIWIIEQRALGKLRRAAARRGITSSF